MTKLSKEYLSKNWRRSYQPIMMSVPPTGSRVNLVFWLMCLSKLVVGLVVAWCQSDEAGSVPGNTYLHCLPYMVMSRTF